MARYTVGGRATIAGSATLPLVSVYAVATSAPKLREVHFFNTTSTGGFTVALCRLSTTGTQGAGLTEVQHDPSTSPPLCTGFAGHTVAPTLVDMGYRKTVAAAIGDGVIWTFPDSPPPTVVLGTGNGLGLYVPNGTGQILDYVLVWEE